MEDEDIRKIEEERKKKINFEMKNRKMRRGYVNDVKIGNDDGFYSQASYSHAFQNQNFYNQSTVQGFQNHDMQNQGFYNQPPYNQAIQNQSFYNQPSDIQPSNNHPNQYQSTFNIDQTVSININNTLHSIPTNITHPQPPSNLSLTNFSLKLSNFYLSNFIFKPDFHQIENDIRQEAQHATSDQILKLKIEINKRLNQVNNDPQKVEMIGNMLKVYSLTHIFIDIFTCKFIEQSTVQISRNLDLSKPFGHLFKKVFTNSLFDFYKASVIKKSGDGLGLKGIFGGFFGVLVELDFVDELWAFGAGLLNGEYNENTFVVLEVYLILGGEYLKSKSKRQFEKLQRYIKKNVLHEIKDKALKFRIGSLV